MGQQVRPEEMLEVSYDLDASDLPRDNAYHLFSAVCRSLGERNGELHGATWFRIGPVQGSPRDRLRIRVERRHLGVMLRLQRKRLRVWKHDIALGDAEVDAIAPHRDLCALRVAVRSRVTREPVIDIAAMRESVRLSLSEIGAWSPGVRVLVGAPQSLTVAQHVVFARTVAVHGLEPAASLRLQAAGVGGRAHMGCGFFREVGRE